MSEVMYSGTHVNRVVPNYVAPSDDAGEAYWLGLPHASVVPSIDQHTAMAQGKFLEHKEANPDFDLMPLTTQYPSHLISKAVYGYTNPKMGADSVEKVQEIFARQLAKAFIAEAPDSEMAQELSKAVTTGSSLMHVIADMDVTMLYKRPYPIQALIPVEANKGKAANYDVIPPFGFVQSSFLSEDPNLVDSDPSPGNHTMYIKYMYSVARVTQAAKFAGFSQYPARDIKAINTDACQESHRGLRERSILGVTRDVTTIDDIAFAAAGDYEYPGLHEIITSNTTAPNYVSSGVDNDYDSIRAGLRDSYKLMVKDGMRPNLIITDYSTFDTLAAGLTEYYRVPAVQEFTHGVSKVNIVFPGGAATPVVPTEFLPMDEGSQAAFMLDTKLLARRVLWQDMYQDLAKINTSDKFVISSAECIIDKTDIDGSTSLQGGVFNIGA